MGTPRSGDTTLDGLEGLTRRACLAHGWYRERFLTVLFATIAFARDLDPDAFMERFVIVRPTGKPLSEALGKWAMDQADYAVSEWTHFFRGEPRVKRDVEITDADIATSNLVLFGDPSSNAIYRRIASRLPIAWRADGVTAGGQTFDANHAPVFVFPNPLNPARYVVINSGFTFHDQSNNDMQSPKLPDWAIVDIGKPGNNYKYLPLFVAAQGFFDESWRLR